MGSYIKEIKINKIRHLEGLTIPISDDGSLKHLIITGPNGSGKTSLLDSMSNLFLKLGIHNVIPEVEVIFVFKGELPHRLLERNYLWAYFPSQRKAQFSQPAGITKIKLHQ